MGIMVKDFKSTQKEDKASAIEACPLAKGTAHKP